METQNGSRTSTSHHISSDENTVQYTHQEPEFIQYTRQTDGYTLKEVSCTAQYVMRVLYVSSRLFPFSDVRFVSCFWNAQ